MGEKTEDPTSKKRDEAKQQGQVPKSLDLSSAILLSGAAVLLVVFGSAMSRQMVMLMHGMLGIDGADAGQMRGNAIADTVRAFSSVGWSAAALMLCMVVVAYLSGLLQVGFMIAPKTIQPDLNKLNPTKGVKRLFSKKTLMKGVLDIGKFVLIATVCWIVAHRHEDTILGLAAMGFGHAVNATGRIALELVLAALLVLIVLGIADFTYQKWQTTQDLKMSKQEVKDERKSTEGDPEAKGRRMRMARELLTQRLGTDVPQSDVVVTNPTHYAVALRYDNETMAAPTVLAKGADFVAMKIRQLAVAHGVPIVERPPLARALYRDVPVGGEVPADHYEAVAEVLAYVYRLEGRAAAV